MPLRRGSGIIQIREEQVYGLTRKFPDARVEICNAPGKLLSDGMHDGKSYRYGLINIRADL